MLRNALLALSLSTLALLGATGCGSTIVTSAETFDVAYTIEMSGSSCSSVQYDPGTGVLVTVANPSSSWHVALTGLTSGATVEIKATCTALPGTSVPLATVTQLGGGSVQGIVVDAVTSQTVFTNTVVSCEKATLGALPQ